MTSLVHLYKQGIHDNHTSIVRWTGTAGASSRWKLVTVWPQPNDNATYKRQQRPKALPLTIKLRKW
ncbi:hypothetical protein BDR06DRAFT_403710 [Suillus hirtellus]|nr:hypothetical protein BDR06DRAFT_403710 [Suillus hirtellus]